MFSRFRITGYYPEKDFCFILDSCGLFEKKWQFSSYLIQRGIKVLEIHELENIEDINISKTYLEVTNIVLKAIAKGKPEYIEYEGKNAIKVADKIYSIK